MADKEHEGVEKEMDMTDAGAPESVAKTTETGSGEGMEEGKLEQQTSDDKKTESEDDPSGAEGIGSRDDEKPEKGSNGFQLFLSMVQALASIATIAVAVFTFFTLKEMQTERDNAYRPEIVIVPNSFEGKILKEDELEIGRDYLFLDYNATSPGEFCSRDYLTYEPEYTDTCICLEKPYLTLKNIGQGTATDIEVTFSSAWFESAVGLLTYGVDSNVGAKGRPYYEFIASINKHNEEESVSITYTDEEGNSDHIQSFMNSGTAIPKVNITYIASGEDSVNVALPESYNDVLAMFYYLPLWNLRLRHEGLTAESVELPDLVITIKYSDMQGKTYPPEEITIPWTGSYKYIRDFESMGWKPGTMEIEASFFDNYSR